MYRIRRTKSELPPPFGIPSVHYATRVAPAGNITGWTGNESQAVLVPEDVAAKVRSFYLGRPKAGLVECLPDKPALPAPAAPVVVKAAPAPVVAPVPVVEAKEQPAAMPVEQEKAAGQHKPRHKHQGSR